MKSSPWIAELPEREFHTSEKAGADIAIIGGGVAGVSTAYFLLTRTQKSVLLLEQNRIGSGATGHNAGHIVAGFERAHRDILKEFDEEKTFNTYRMLLNSWGLLDEMHQAIGKNTPFYMTKSYAGFTEIEDIFAELEMVQEMEQRKISSKTNFLFSDEQYLSLIPEQYRSFCKLISVEKFSSIIPAKYSDYIAIVEKERGLINSAHFVEMVTDYLLSKYKERFFVVENEPVKKISFQEHEVVIMCKNKIITAQHVILCTNGYKGFEIEDSYNRDLQARYQNKVEGITEFMIGYEYEESGKIETFGIHNINLLPERDLNKESLAFSYLYLSERPYQGRTLLVAGGVESLKQGELATESSEQKSAVVYPFLNSVIKNNLSYVFLPQTPTRVWHGLMGYTKNLIRIVGKEPKNQRLIYNIGCNGIGILPSIASGERIARMMLGEKMEGTIFDTE
jgi:glycine/D-amino acid oxidase-like deaminating enzyme